MRLVRPIPDTMTQMTLRRDVVTTENELCDRCRDAAAGTAITYHIGMLARDRDRQTTTLDSEDRRRVHAVASRASQLAAAGWADLVQRRLDDHCFAYLLVVRRRPLSTRSARALDAPSLPLAEAA